MANIFNIKSNYKFLDSLVRWVLDKYRDDYLTLSNMLILLPTKRSCVEIKKIFLNNSDKDSVILPQIKAIGSVDYDDLILNFNANPEDLNEVIKPTKSLQYRLLLVEEIKLWLNSIGEKNVSFEQILNLAFELENFLSAVKRESLNIDNLENLVDFAYSEHWEKILRFLQIFGFKWQGVLKQNNIISSTDYIIKMLELNQKALKESPPKYPIIVAGSTGSVPANAELIRTISKFENCAVILNGLETEMSTKTWGEIDEFSPQFMLKKLLDKLGIVKENVQNIEYENLKKSEDSRRELATLAMLPASETCEWTSKNTDEKIGNSISNIKLVECKNETEEANIISFILREFVENKDEKLAIITDDSKLIARIKNNLKRFEIKINDSIGVHLSDNCIVDYLKLLDKCINEKFSISSFISLMKHPLTSVGYSKNDFTKLLNKFEIDVRKSHKKFDSFFEYEEAIKDDEEVLKWFLKIKILFKDLLEKISISSLNLAKITEIYIGFIETLTNTDLKTSQEILWDESDVDGEVYNFFHEIILQGDNFIVELKDYFSAIKFLISGKSLKEYEGLHPRLHILKSVEARLLEFDTVIIPNMNEGEFPEALKTDPWMSKAMKKNFGFPADERKIGIACYDFVNLIMNKNVILTRSLTKGDSPTNKSRFLLRLEAVSKITGKSFENCKYIQEFLCDYFNVERTEKIEQPNPKPPVQYRPKGLSATQIETLIRNPYEIYAKKVLYLEKLERVDKKISFAEFGSCIHEALENFILDYDEIPDEEKLEKLKNFYGKNAFKKYFGNSSNVKLWWSRFENIADWFVENEKEIHDLGKKVFVEKQVETEISGFKLKAKIDRIHIDKEGNLDIIDYKTTGDKNTYSARKAEIGEKPQLPIEGLIIKEIGMNFGDRRVSNISNLEYWITKGNKQDCEVISISNNPETTAELIETAKEGLINLINYFKNEQNGFISSIEEDTRNDYDHLSRRGEW